MSSHAAAAAAAAAAELLTPRLEDSLLTYKTQRHQLTSLTKISVSNKIHSLSFELCKTSWNHLPFRLHASLFTSSIMHSTADLSEPTPRTLPTYKTQQFIFLLFSQPSDRGEIFKYHCKSSHISLITHPVGQTNAHPRLQITKVTL